MQPYSGAHSFAAARTAAVADANFAAAEQLAGRQFCQNCE